jgi:hypothetical protein
VIIGVVVLAGCEDEDSMHPIQNLCAAIEREDPGRLKTIMVPLGQDMDEVSRGLWLEDLAAPTTARHYVSLIDLRWLLSISVSVAE